MKNNKSIRHIKKRTPDPVLELWVKAGGRCEFHGCNKYLLDDEFTGIKHINLAELAHIVPRSRRGPRGENDLPQEEINKPDNLMLLCAEHHDKIIDKRKLVKEFSVERLKRYKKNHEERIFFLTEIKPGHETTVIRLISKIHGSTVNIPQEQIRQAVLDYDGRYPRYFWGNDIEIDLTNNDETNMQYWNICTQKIQNIMERFYFPMIEKEPVKHISVFALARIPLLVYFGRLLSDKIPTNIFQKHRDGQENWIWRKAGKIHDFEIKKIQKGSRSSNIALLISISGKILKEELPHDISLGFTIFEIIPKGTVPDTGILKRIETLNNFQDCYRRLLRRIESGYPKAKIIHLFIAAPSPIAISCGRQRLLEVSYSLMVYDKVNQQYKFIMEVK
jgi:hypothetical protein